MIKNNKGFMLAEAVITSTVVLTSLVGLYATFNRLYGAYMVRESYYDIDGFYAIREVVDYYLPYGNFIHYLLELENREYLSLTTDSISSVEVYNIRNMYILKCDKDSLDSLKGVVLNQTFKDYIDFVLKYYDYSEKKSYEYLILVEYGEDDDLHYSSMGIG